MEQFCTLLWGIIGAAALAASTVVSWMLDNWPAFSSWFEPLPAALKMIYGCVATDAFYLAAGAYVEIMVYHDDVAARNTGGASVYDHRDCFGYLRGPL